MVQARRRRELFSEDRLQKIFGNIEQLEEFHVHFLDDVNTVYGNKSSKFLKTNYKFKFKRILNNVFEIIDNKTVKHLVEKRV